MPERKAISGVVTIQGSWYKGTIARQESIELVTDDKKKPLKLHLGVDGRRSEAYVTGIREDIFQYGEYEGSETGTFSFQVSDMKPDFYETALELGTEVWKNSYNYDGSDERLSNTQKIVLYSVDSLLQDIQISVCTDPMPVFCDSSPDSTMLEVVHGKRYELTCSASGAPFLKADWTHNGRKPAIHPVGSSTLLGAQYDLKSSIIIASLDDSHYGTWECIIYNKNFGYATSNSIKKSFHFYPVTLLRAPTSFLIDPRNDSNEFEFLVEGYPLDSVYPECLPSVGIKVRQTTIHTSSQPRNRFEMSVSSDAANEFKCRINGSENTAIFNELFLKVGSRCKSGTFGMGNECLLCPHGTTSGPGSVTCDPVDEPCPDGQYGSGSDCQECPEGTVTAGCAAKEKDCTVVPEPNRICLEGQYGAWGHCQHCPEGLTSPAGAVKRQECLPCSDTNLCVTLKDSHGSYTTLWVVAFIFAILLAVLGGMILERIRMPLRNLQCFDRVSGQDNDTEPQNLPIDPNSESADQLPTIPESVPLFDSGTAELVPTYTVQKKKFADSLKKQDHVRHRANRLPTKKTADGRQIDSI